MSLENIQLPSSVLRNLFKRSLVTLDTIKDKLPDTKSVPVNGFPANKADVAIITGGVAVAAREEQDNVFLSEIMKACKLGVDGYNIFNSDQTPDLNYEVLDKFSDPSKIILFGLEAIAFGLPFHIPDFQVQSYNKKKYLVSPSLAELEKDKTLKSKLWAALKKLFDL